jgi:hypothetical protein
MNNISIYALDIMTYLFIRSLFNDAVSNWNCKMSNDGMTVNKELEMMWKETKLPSLRYYYSIRLS